MAVYLDEKEEESRREELKEYEQKIAEQINEDRLNAKARRKKQDKVFQKILLTTALAIIVAMVITWAR